MSESRSPQIVSAVIDVLADSDQDLQQQAHAVLDALDTERWNESVKQMADMGEYVRVYNTDERHPCQVEGCPISQEEHHRLAFGLITENRELKRQLQEG